MLRGLLIAVLVAAGLCLGGSLAQPAAPAPEAAAPDLEQMAYDVEHLPMINALGLTRAQIERLVPVLEAAAAERERMAQQPPMEALEALTRLREALLRGETPEVDLKDIRKQASRLADKGRPAMDPKEMRKHPGLFAARTRAVAELARLAGQMAEILTDDQIDQLVDPRAKDKRGPAGEAAVGEALSLLRRLPPAAYTARREALVEAIVSRTQPPGTFEFEAARTQCIADFDRIRQLSDEEFARQRDRLAADFWQRWGALPMVGDKRRLGKMREGRGEDQIEKLYAVDEQQYRQRREEVVDAAVRRRLALDPDAEEKQVRAEIVRTLDEMRALPPLEFQNQKAEIAESLFGAEGGAEFAFDPRAMAALSRLADRRMIALLKAKAEYL